MGRIRHHEEDDVRLPRHFGGVGAGDGAASSRVCGTPLRDCA